MKKYYQAKIFVPSKSSHFKEKKPTKFPTFMNKKLKQTHLPKC